MLAISEFRNLSLYYTVFCQVSLKLIVLSKENKGKVRKLVGDFNNKSICKRREAISELEFAADSLIN